MNVPDGDSRSWASGHVNALPDAWSRFAFPSALHDTSGYDRGSIVSAGSSRSPSGSFPAKLTPTDAIESREPTSIHRGDIDRAAASSGRPFTESQTSLWRAVALEIRDSANKSFMVVEENMKALKESNSELQKYMTEVCQNNENKIQESNSALQMFMTRVVEEQEQKIQAMLTQALAGSSDANIKWEKAIEMIGSGILERGIPSEQTDVESEALDTSDARDTCAKSKILKKDMHTDTALISDIEALQLAGIKDGCAGQTNWYVKSLLKRVGHHSLLQQVLEFCHLSRFFPSGPPVENYCSKMVQSTQYELLTLIVTIANAAVMGFEADVSIRKSLQEIPEDPPKWIATIDMVFTSFFIFDLLLRLIVLGVWFFVCPAFAWNYLDIALVMTSVLADFDIGMNLRFFRLLRVFRLVRIVKIIRVSTFFRHLRKMMLSIAASITSLAWAFAFLMLIMFMFSVFFLNGACAYLKENNYDNALRATFSQWYTSLPQTMFSLLVAISGGTDWIAIMAPVKQISWTYQCVFTFYVIFVIVGVLNVLTGVFLESAADYRDRDLTVQDEIQRVDGFVKEMIDLFHEFHPDGGGSISWEQFNEYLHKQEVEAYLSSHLLETSHARLLFRMLDSDGTGEISIEEFVIGMLRVKGGAKAYDNRVLLHEISQLREQMDQIGEALQTVKGYGQPSAHTLARLQQAKTDIR